MGGVRKSFQNISASDPSQELAEQLITLNSVTDEGFQTRIRNFYTKLQTDGLLTKFYALYITIFNDAAKNKWNWVNLADTDAAFRAVFSGIMTHTNDRIIPSSNSKLRTFFNPVTQGINAQDVSLGAYLLENMTGFRQGAAIVDTNNGWIVGAVDTTAPYKGLTGAFRQGALSRIYMDDDHSVTYRKKPNGLYIATRTSDTCKIYHNKTEILSQTSASTFLPNYELDGLGTNYDGVHVFSSTPICCNFIAKGMSATDVNNLNDALGALLTNIIIPSNNAYFFGDSITRHDPLPTSSWAIQLSTSRGWSHYNHSQNGFTTTSVYNELLVKRFCDYDASDSVVFLAAGVNDLIGVGGSVATYAARLTDMINFCIARGFPLTKIKVLNLFYITNFQNGSLQMALDINAACATVTTNAGVQMVDIWTWMENNGAGTLLSDGVHPTTAAQGLISAYIDSVLTF
jgi:lysophospholipase L1-like esterase